jgi:hypothetical protein
LQQTKAAKIADATEQALRLLDEIKEKYEESARLINLRTVALIRAGKYEEAVKLSNKLTGAMGAKESLYDKIELETSLSLLAAASLSLNKTAEREAALKTLRETNQHSLLLKELASVEHSLQIL